MGDTSVAYISYCLLRGYIIEGQIGQMVASNTSKNFQQKVIAKEGQEVSYMVWHIAVARAKWLLSQPLGNDERAD